ncbi:MAG: glycoside hydrolase family 2 [Oscillospiraceae bacterium]|nr:glycoside hydrolase family 2 [Oscillospiraceae bacterium]
MNSPTLKTLYTRWGKTLCRENPLPEYPRPQLQRESWQSLNGVWSYAVRSKEIAMPRVADGEIVVPFSPECVLSGAAKAPTSEETLWYWCEFYAKTDCDKRLLLHFGAVDQCCTVYLNGKEIGAHAGGYLPFSIEILDTSIQNGINKLCVAVRDEGDGPLYAYGKQRKNRGGIWYTPQSGIWQSVWLESVPREYIQNVKLTPLYDEGKIHFTIQADFKAAPLFTVKIFDGEKCVATEETKHTSFAIAIEKYKSWSPDSPFLYTAEITAGADKVCTYFGMRKFSTGPDARGKMRLLLNNKPIFHTGLLDQGYWSDGLYTPPSDEAIIWELSQIKAMGFNMLRKHIKIEPLRWYYHCDRLGIMVWQDFVSGGAPYSSLVTQVLPFLGKTLNDCYYKRFGRENAEGRAIFERDMQDTVNTLYNTVSLAVWVPFNEGWGQFDSARITEALRRLDATRSIDAASGWHDQGAGDFCSKHIYYKKYRLQADKQGRVQALTEFGGYSCPCEAHMSSDKLFGYRMFQNGNALTKAFVQLYETEVIPALKDGLSAAIYTQVSDVEDEINGIFTYDREVQKLNAAAVRRINKQLTL